ncbi:MAG: 50S ribosomal protein L20 [Candidatus Sungbacteria bacterium RIFCSPHIGHO2_02_FULL_47_11]|uniref:Large ribosomal subunit protein bL20 n=1 Tax=Candidatus Sungbacteria bacterium RIFCSPHIGHO2_02_FULL_47_11 TaxID=1802270 RepID=A0A1G2KGS3_9BACT|nr:MAG: 50S ribosomal protein L20 [Candidatus Sungbacteria bacterium RIFCSPHIGHO2_02_FULL_47_11]
MVRVKRGVIAHKKREKLLHHVKGFKWGRKSKERLAREALLHAWSHSFVGRKRKKRDFRRLWQIKINTAVREHDLSYSRFMASLNKKSINLDRKILAELAEYHPNIFKEVVETIR